jgi:hypothetical protein
MLAQIRAFSIYISLFTNPSLPSPNVVQLRLVALDSPRSGALHGVLGVDYQCFREAAQNSYQGSFRGFLASPQEKASQGGHNLESIVRYQDRDLPVVNVRVSRHRGLSTCAQEVQLIMCFRGNFCFPVGNQSLRTVES